MFRSTLYRISQDPTYNNKLFAVKFMSTFDIQTMPDTVMSPLRDSSLLAPDCFHFSKRLHARMARNLWNDLFQEDGRYGQEYNFDPPLFCPSQQLPYFNIKQFNKQWRGPGAICNAKIVMPQYMTLTLTSPPPKKKITCCDFHHIFQCIIYAVCCTCIKFTLIIW